MRLCRGCDHKLEGGTLIVLWAWVERLNAFCNAVARTAGSLVLTMIRWPLPLPIHDFTPTSHGSDSCVKIFDM